MHPQEEVVEQLAPLVRTVFKPNSKRIPVFVGSGFVILSDQKMFFVTATHVMNLLSDSSPLFFDGNTKLLQLAGVEHVWPKKDNNGKHNEVDLSLIELEEQISKKVEKSMCVNLDNLTTDEVSGESAFFLVMGNPEKSNKNSVSSTTNSIESNHYSLFSVEASGDSYNSVGANPKSHIVLSWDKKKAQSLEGVKRTAPDLNGLSGAPIWMLLQDEVTIAGVLTECHAGTKKVIVGHRISYISNAIKTLTKRPSSCLVQDDA